jgi:sugar lactone lactonase YvrE
MRTTLSKTTVNQTTPHTITSHRKTTRRKRTLTAALTAVLVTGALTVSGGQAAAAPAPAERFPAVIDLPDGFQPEGISTGRGTSFYVGSLVDGAIYRGDVRTGDGDLLVRGRPGLVAAGTEVDRNRLFVSGATDGSGRIYDAASGELLRTYQFVPAGTGFINDVVVTRDAAYFTDSLNPVIYVVPFGPGGRLPAGDQVHRLPLIGAISYGPGFNLNGIEASPNGRTLLAVQSNTAKLFAISATTGVATEVDLGGVALTNGDGLLRQGTILYVVQNRLNRIAVVELSADYRSGTVTRTITSTDFQVPTTVAKFGSSLYAVNARFGTPPTPTTDYTVVRVSAR